MSPKTDFSKWEDFPDEVDPDRALKRVLILAQIRQNATGELRIYKTDGYFFAEDIQDDTQHPSTYIWEEGNYSCDCNRRLFFARAGGEEEDDEVVCTDGLFAVNLLNPKTGECFYREFETPDAA